MSRASSRLRSAVRAFRGRPADEHATSPFHRSSSIDDAIATLADAPIREVQGRGYHFQKYDYYSALNDLAFLSANWDLWHDRPLPRGIAWDLDAQLDEVRRIAPYVRELSDVPWDPPSGPPQYYWNNDFWRGADAKVHYGLLRDLKPRRIVEIGTGWSSLLMAQALRRNEAEGAPPRQVDQVDPFPRRQLLSALPEDWQLHEAVLQRAGFHLFDALGPGDVCFYDGSHVARAGSDVVWFFFEVLPRLAPGVLIHVHDVFWPSDYPDEWIFERGQTWNEQYILQAFLMYNREFTPLVCNAPLFDRHRDVLRDLYKGTADSCKGVSVWLSRTASAEG